MFEFETIETANLVMELIAGTSMKPEQVAKFCHVTLAYCCGVNDGYTGGDEGAQYLDVPPFPGEVDQYQHGYRRGQQLAEAEEANDSAA